MNIHGRNGLLNYFKSTFPWGRGTRLSALLEGQTHIVIRRMAPLPGNIGTGVNRPIRALKRQRQAIHLPWLLFPLRPWPGPLSSSVSRKPSREEQVGQEGPPLLERALPPASGKGKGASQAKLPSSCPCLPPPRTRRLSAPKPPAPPLPEARSTGRTVLPSSAHPSPFASLGEKKVKGLKNPLVGKSRLTFPGSSRGRGTFRKHLFSERLCRMEF